MLISFFFLFFFNRKLFEITRIRSVFKASAEKRTDKRVRRLKNKFFTVQFVLPLDTRNSFYEK